MDKSIQQIIDLWEKDRRPQVVEDIQWLGSSIHLQEEMVRSHKEHIDTMDKLVKQFKEASKARK
jgi:hypothetical protein